METGKKLKLLQLFYAGVLADAIDNYERFGIREAVTDKKAAEQLVMARGQRIQMGIETSEQMFTTFSDIFGCIQWNVTLGPGTVTGEGGSCLLCAIAKKKGTAQPCRMYCINPMTAMAAALEPSCMLTVRETLWDGNRCRFEITLKD